jgi:hypothetical protein
MKVLARPDVDLEAKIEVAYNRFVKSTKSERRKRWDEFTALLAKRSPARVKRMERDRGLDKRATFEPREAR